MFVFLQVSCDDVMVRAPPLPSAPSPDDVTGKLDTARAAVEALEAQQAAIREQQTILDTFTTGVLKVCVCVCVCVCLPLSLATRVCVCVCSCVHPTAGRPQRLQCAP